MGFRYTVIRGLPNKTIITEAPLHHITSCIMLQIIHLSCTAFNCLHPKPKSGDVVDIRIRAGFRLNQLICSPPQTDLHPHSSSFSTHPHPSAGPRIPFIEFHLLEARINRVLALDYHQDDVINDFFQWTPLSGKLYTPQAGLQPTRFLGSRAALYNQDHPKNIPSIPVHQSSFAISQLLSSLVPP